MHLFQQILPSDTIPSLPFSDLETLPNSSLLSTNSKSHELASEAFSTGKPSKASEC